jgi:hypothetical protein
MSIGLIFKSWGGKEKALQEKAADGVGQAKEKAIELGERIKDGVNQVSK